MACAYVSVDPGDVDAVEEDVADGEEGERGDVELPDVEPLGVVRDDREPDAVERLHQHAGQNVHVLRAPASQPTQSRAQYSVKQAISLY